MTSNGELIQQYDDALLRTVNHKGHRTDCKEAVINALDTVIYGGLVRNYLTSALSLADGGPVESAVEPHKDDIVDSIDLLSRAAVRTEKGYSNNIPGVLNDPNFRKEIENLQVNVAQGLITLLSQRFGMKPEEGRSQVEFADAEFSSLGREVQLLMAGLNYANFTSKTMFTGRALLTDKENLDLSGWTEKQMQQSMPHLVLSNMAIGQIVSALLQGGKPGEQFTIVDTGSGTGCTLAGSVLGVHDAMVKGFDSNRLSITGIEGGRKFFVDELMPFVDIAIEQMSNVPLTKTVLPKPTHHEVANGQFNLIYGDILESLKLLRLSKEIQEGVVIVTANYVWHRLPSVVKDAMIKEITRKAPNAIFLVADLVQNASEVNRRYFNFRDNGLFNCGNMGLDHAFESNGYKFIELNSGTAPRGMDPGLAGRIGQGTTSDSIFYIAYQGEKAAGLVENW